MPQTIPHPWKEGETRSKYEFPITRKIIIEADHDIPYSEIVSMAERYQDKEIRLDVIGGGYKVSLSEPSIDCNPPSEYLCRIKLPIPMTLLEELVNLFIGQNARMKEEDGYLCIFVETKQTES